MEGPVLDRAGVAHAAIAGQATRVHSTVPIGGGSSHSMALSGTGTYTFEGTGMKFTFTSPSSHPNGNVVVTQLTLTPDSLLAFKSPFSEYWIVNNYGVNQDPQVDTMTITPSTQVSPHLIGQPSDIILSARSANGYLNNWTTVSATASADSSSIRFAGLPNMELGQIVIYDGNCPDSLLINDISITKHLDLYAGKRIVIDGVQGVSSAGMVIKSPEILLRDLIITGPHTLTTYQKNGCLNE